MARRKYHYTCWFHRLIKSYLIFTSQYDFAIDIVETTTTVFDLYSSIPVMAYC
ncbi:hypothetical protein [Thomasclavelia spiroformis]|uniref:hypothetical protein n=1 Tax=Thomasclavelia spiroformis TaxID=29348 RepID=UPI0026DBC785|nr:hypothetical protein [Thomasclavelia spiroformis]